MRLLSPTGDAGADILAFMRWRQTGVTFWELKRFLPALEGTHDLLLDDQDTLVVWRGLSREAVDAVQSLIAEGKVELQRVNPLFYSLEGYVPELPVATTLRDYRSPRWLPMTLSLAHATPRAAVTAHDDDRNGSTG